jgi:signal transduction histidine kinase
VSRVFDRWEWPFRDLWLDVAWAVFAVANLVAMVRFADWETVPFHFIWVSLTLLYGFRVWRVKPTIWTLGAVMVGTAVLIWVDVSRHAQPLDELTEVPLMAAMFLAMVWHARRRLSATEEIQRVSETNLKLLERERRFLQDASHELRTPITIALGQVELIQRTAQDPVIKEDASVAVDELMRLRKLAERLLLLASAEHPEFLQRERIDVGILIHGAVRRWEATPRTWIADDVAEAEVDVDPERMSLALDSLVENAVKHTSPGDRIELGARAGADTVSIVISDSGAGIPPENLDQIFDRFARADSSRSREAGGFGLGLSIVKAIVEAHGGSVSVSSRHGEGTSFELRLPRASGPSPHRRGSTGARSLSTAGSAPARP